jgi:hypothetical protein
MTPNTRFAAILVPNGLVQDVSNNPAIGGDKRPLFSVPSANPYAVTPQLRGQVGDLDGHGSVFAFEDLRLDGSSDRDYNDLVFQVTGARGFSTPVEEVTNPTRDFRNTPVGGDLLDYGQEQQARDVLGTTGGYQGGTSRVGNEGQLQIDFLYDGGGYVGEMAIFSLQGMNAYTPGSPEFIREAARRALTDSTLGHVVISDRLEGARSSVKFSFDGAFNQGPYLGIKTFEMMPGDIFAFMLVPNGSVWEVYNNSAASGNKRPLFSVSEANPSGPTGNVHMADITGTGTVLGFEDQRQDAYTDRDYNDIVFRLIGAETSATSYASVVNTARTMLGTTQLAEILS